MRPKRSLGQVFLRDKKYAADILDCLDIRGRRVLEIGPGDGSFSEHILKKSKYFYCIEFDSRFCNFLKEKFSGQPNIKIIQGDILKFPLPQLGKKLVIFGNVPYQISSRLISYLVRQRKYIDKAYLTFQKEFVQKLTAQPSTAQYSHLSCYIQYYAKIEKMFELPSRAFWPPPKVDSSFVTIEFYRRLPYRKNKEELLFEVIGKAFRNRRKKIVNALPNLQDKYDFFSSLKINPDLRAENLSLKEYMNITNKLYRNVSLKI